MGRQHRWQAGRVAAEDRRGRYRPHWRQGFLPRGREAGDVRMEPAPAPEEQPVGVRTATNLQELVVELMEADPSLSTVKALKNKIEAVADELSFRVEPKELKHKALAKMMGKERSAKPVRAPGPSSQVASPPPGAHVEDGAGSAAASERTAREPAAAAQLEHRAAVAVPLRD